MFSNGFPKEWSTLRKLAWLYRTVINAVSAVLKTVTGNPIHILDALAKPAQALSVKLEPIQDLNGYDNPWPAGGGKNLYDASTFPTTTAYGVTCTNNGDGSFTLNGTAASDVFFDIFNSQFDPNSGGTSLPSAEYRLTGCPSVGGVSTYDLYVRPTYSADYGNGATFTDGVTGGSLFVKAGYTCNNLVFWPMIRLASNGDDTYAPYSNICPISGHSSVNVIVSPTLNPLDGTITNIPLGGTYYGGQLDVLTGVLTVTHANIPSYNGESINDPWISSMDAYSPGATPTTGAQVVYPLATPITIQLTPTQVELLLGENNIWSDGEMTLTYLADGNASDVEALNILLGGRYVNNHGEDEPTDREALDILLGRTK